MSVLSDIWDGITQGIGAKVSQAESRLENKTGVSPTQGNTGSYLGLSIVDTISQALHGNADALQKAVLNSKTGQKLVSTATKNQVAALVGDWRSWALIIGFILLFMFLGHKIGKRA